MRHAAAEHRSGPARRRSCGATALPAALAALAVSAALTAALADLARVETMLARQRQRTVAALAAADQCVADVVAGVPAGWDFAPLLAGPDGVAGNGDDGTLVVPAECVATIRNAPGPASPPHALLTITGTRDDGRRAFDAVLARAVDPGVAALLWLGTAPTGGVAGTLTLDGTDGVDPLAPAWTGVAAIGAADAIDGWLAAQGPHIVLGPSTSSARSAPAPPLVALEQRLVALGAGDPRLLPAAGTRPGGLARVAGDLRIDTAFTGAGILFVGGSLDIRAAFDFTGVVVASGGLRVAAGASLRLAGSVWCGGPLDVSGVASLRQDHGAVADVDGRVALPRLALVAGVKDL